MEKFAYTLFAKVTRKIESINTDEENREQYYERANVFDVVIDDDDTK